MMMRLPVAVTNPLLSRPTVWRMAGLIALVVAAAALVRHRGQLNTVDASAILFALAGSAGGFLCLLRSRAPRWFAASFPWWALVSAHPVFALLAFALTTTGLLSLALGPMRPGQTVFRPGDPLPPLAKGPLVPITPASFAGGSSSRLISALVAALAALALILTGLAAPDHPERSVLAIAAVITASGMWLSNWMASRCRLRVDGHGLHSRLLFREHTVPWLDVAGITTRYIRNAVWHLRGVLRRLFVHARVRVPEHHDGWGGAQSHDRVGHRSPLVGG